MTTTRTMFDGEMDVAYRQFSVTTDGAGDGDASVPLPEAAFAGQRVGLCGAAAPGALWLTTGLHTGLVPLRAELHDEPPPLDAAWEEAVEVSFTPAGLDVWLSGWAGQSAWPLPLEPVGYRVRYCAAGFTAGHTADTRRSGEPELDRYLLQFWPAPPAPDRLLRETSPHAASWHRYARGLPPPPTAQERARAGPRSGAEWSAGRAAIAERARREEVENLRWGGSPPADAGLRAAGGSAPLLYRLDRELTGALPGLSPGAQRRLARWAARRACVTAGVAGTDWIAPALAAVERGDRPPRDPFASRERTVRRLLGPGESGPLTLSIHLARHQQSASPQLEAVTCLWSAGEDDPLRAAIGTLYGAALAHGEGAAAFLADAREEVSRAAGPN